MKRISACVMAALLVSGCGGQEETLGELQEIPTISDNDVANLAMKLAWDDTPAEDKATLCAMYQRDEELFISLWIEEARTNEAIAKLTVSDIESFFESAC